ncbi:MAG: hypothetical protein P4L51_07105 [Puia sp.]|nr:hypothetical protein [Puia sp.]
MKKFLLIASLMLALTGFNFAQTTPAKTTTTTTAGPKKKDGTADMRYKANKNAAKPPVHTKKDGTADKRFKENKTPK